MTANYVLLERITVGASGAASVTFNNIPQTGYTDLKVVMSARGLGHYNSNPWANTGIKINGTAVTSNKTLYGTGSAAGSEGGNGIYYGVPSDNATTNTFGNTEIYIPNYTSSNYKSISVDGTTENNGTAALATMVAMQSPSTAAVTNLTIYFTQTGETGFAQYSTFSLYALSAVGTTPVIAPYASGGDIIQTDGTYWYHAFLSSGYFTPNKALSCDYLVVAGGGGGASASNAGNSEGGGGGGAGGLRSTVTATGGGGSLESKLSLNSNTPYTVTIGSGGSGGAVSNNNGSQGSNSVFASITSLGGGYGGHSSTSGNAGGSGGGGGAGPSGSNGTGGAGTTSQGYAGGDGYQSARAGAGGGAGGPGESASGLYIRGGNGGTGVAISAFASATGTGVSNYYAGGGGGGEYGTGGAGGAGGGGAGGSTTLAGTNGTPNTGGGGGGTSFNYVGGTGGSGILIVRYAI